jgi:hypothetical protein
MAYSIIRIAKLTSQVHACNATSHNYRQREVPNADAAAQHPNREYVNHAKTDYWTLAEARIAEVVTRKVRADQVRVVEVIMTGSPEAFIRDKDGRAADYSNSQWAVDNLNFLKMKFGEKNVVSFTLHQDEKTPHIHAVLVPITPDGRLSAKDTFTRQSLRELQTDYAQAMASHGMSRGIEHSQAEHQPMRRQYGQEAKQARQVAELSQPLPAIVHEPFRLDEVPLMGRDAWKAKQEDRINTEIAHRVAHAQRQERERAEKLAKLAQENSAAAERVKTLQKQLSTSEGLKQGNYDQLQTVQTTNQNLVTRTVRIAVRSVQGDHIGGAEREMVIKLREETRQRMEVAAQQVLASQVGQRGFAPAMLAQGYQLGGSGGRAEFVDVNTSVRISISEINPNGRDLWDQLKAQPLAPSIPPPKKVITKAPKPRLKR